MVTEYAILTCMPGMHCHTFTYMFNVVQGHVYTVGQGESGQLGLGPSVGGVPTATCIPFPYDMYNIVFVTTGIAHNSMSAACLKILTTYII